MKHYQISLLLSLFALLLVGSSVYAQKKSNGINIYLGGGVNLSSASVAGYYDQTSESTSRFSFGFFADKKIKGGLSARSGFFYNGLGREYAEGDKSLQDEFNYFTIPLQAKYSFKESPFSLYAGPQFSYLINATSKPDSDTRLLMTDNFQRLILSIKAVLEVTWTKSMPIICHLIQNISPMHIPYELFINSLSN